MEEKSLKIKIFVMDLPSFAKHLVFLRSKIVLICVFLIASGWKTLRLFVMIR